jgi:PKD repeat protein
MSGSRATLLLSLTVALVACESGPTEDTGSSNQGPVARVSVTPPNGPAPLTVTISGESSSDEDGTIASYAWTFGDGTNATGPRVEHSYAAVGEYTINLTVTDNDSATGTATAKVVAAGATAVYNGSLFDTVNYQNEPESGTYDSTVLQ